MDNYDTTKFFVGTLCRRGHNFQETGGSLRRIGNNACVECDKEKWRDRKQSRVSSSQEKTFLGKLCPSNHRADDSDLSVRYTRSGSCVHCVADRDRLYRQKNAEKISERRKIYAEQNKERISARGKAYHQKNKDAKSAYSKEYRLKNKARLLEQNRNYRKQNAARLKEQKAAYRERTGWYDNYMRSYAKRYYQEKQDEINEKHRLYRMKPEAKALAKIRKAKRRVVSMSIHSVSYTKDELMDRFSRFDNCCAYCQSPEKITLDHFIPISKGGSDNIGNIVPSCSPCNSSKKNTDPIDWFERQEFYSPSRLRVILKILGKDKNNYDQIPLL